MLLAAGTRFVVTNTITTGDLTVVSIKEVQTGLPPPEAIPAEPEPEHPAAGIPIRTLAALSDATQETVEDLLGYSATEMEQLFSELQVGIVGQKRIQREIDGLRAVIEPEPEPEAAPEPEPSRVLVMGGFDGSSYLNTAELYDPQSQTWSAVPPMGSKRAYLASSREKGGSGAPPNSTNFQ